MENKPAAPLGNNNPEKSARGVSRRVALRHFGGVLAAGALATSIDFISPRSASADPLTPRINVLNSAEGISISKEKKVEMVGRLGRMMGDFLNPQALDEIKKIDYFDEKGIRIEGFEKDGNKLYFFYGRKGEKEIKFATFEEVEGKIVREVNILTDISGEDRLGELADKAKSMLKEEVDFIPEGFIDIEDLQGSASGDEKEVKQTVIRSAKFPESKIVRRNVETGRPIYVENIIMVHPHGFIRFMQNEGNLMPGSDISTV